MNQTKNVPNNRRMETITGFLKPIIIYELLDETTDRELADEISSYVRKELELDREEKLFGVFRAVPISKLKNVIRTGVDVDPTDSPIFVDGPGASKAIEYGRSSELDALVQAGIKRAGENARIMMMYDMRKLKNTWEEVDSNINNEALEVLKKTYPNQLLSRVEGKIWLSKLDKDEG